MTIAKKKAAKNTGTGETSEGDENNKKSENLRTNLIQVPCI